MTGKNVSFLTIFEYYYWRRQHISKKLFEGQEFQKIRENSQIK